MGALQWNAAALPIRAPVQDLVQSMVNCPSLEVQPLHRMRPPYILKYRGPGKRPNTERWEKREVNSTREAVEWMNANKDKAFLPAFVQTRAWRTETVAILG